MKPIDPLQLQRLIDGELDNQQVQQILADAKSSPEQWREIAVGFVENQVWSSAFNKENDLISDLTCDAVDSFQSASSMAPDSSLSKPASSKLTQSPNYSWLAIAASLLAMAMIGYMAGQIHNRQLSVMPIAENDVKPANQLQVAENTTDRAVPQMTPTDFRPAEYHLEVPSEHLGELASAGPVAPVPLYTVVNADQLKQLNRQQNSSALSPKLLLQLTDSGYQMEQDVDFISGHLGDGRSFVVPVRTIQFVPGQ